MRALSHIIVESCILCTCFAIVYASDDQRLHTILALQYLHMINILLMSIHRKIGASPETTGHIQTYSCLCILADTIAIIFIITGAYVRIHEQPASTWVLRTLYILLLMFAIVTSIWNIWSLRPKIHTREQTQEIVPKTQYTPYVPPPAIGANLRIRIPALKIRGF